MDTLSSSSPEITADEELPEVDHEKVYVAVGKDEKEGKSSLLWALQKFAKEKIIIVLLHVYCAPKMIPMMGVRIPANNVKQKEVDAYKKMEMQKINETLDQYLYLCAKEKVQAQRQVVESHEIAEGIVELVAKHQITTLVMGAAADKYYMKKLKIPKSRKARFVEQNADKLCKIWFICKGTLIYAREAIANTENSEAALSLEQRSASFSEKWCVSNTWIHKPMIESQIERASTVPPYILENLGKDEENKDLYENQQVFEEVESWKQRAYQETLKRKEAERNFSQALRKVKDLEDLHFKEMKARNEAVERLTMEVETLRKQTNEISAKLQNDAEQKLVLEKRNAHSDRIIRDLMLQRDNALRMAEASRSKKGDLTPNTNQAVHVAEFSVSELNEATKNFDVSSKIGQGGYGSVYKGSLRHTTVAIKKLNSESMQSRFKKEVEILSKVRHPNLVTLIGACQEAHALVYEYLPNGSLDDRLACKDNTKPLSWQQRIRIISEICSTLIFLHSSKPHGVVHGDLKPSNILLDANYVSKLGDFGLCRMMDEEFKNTTTLYRHTHPKGTFVYMDPEYLISGDLTSVSDVYSFGIIILRLLTGRSGLGLLKDVQQALERDSLQAILDPSAGDWPVMQAEELARMALRCCEIRRKNRPDLRMEVWSVLQPVMKSASVNLSCSSFKSVLEDINGVPSYFICPIVQDIMREPLIAADGFTYEADAIKEWFDSGHLTSPMTNLQLPYRDLIPNHALRSAIQEWLQQQP